MQKLHAAVENYIEVTDASDPSEVERRKAVEEIMEGFRNYYNPRKIFIQKHTAERIDEFEKKLLGIAQDFMWDIDQYRNSAHRDREAWTKAWKAMSDEVSPLFELLEQDFQQLLGFSSSTKGSHT